MMAAIGLVMAVMLMQQAEPGDQLLVPTFADEPEAPIPPPQATIPVNVPAQIDVHNEMGKKFKLVEAVVLLDAVEVARLRASEGGELERNFRAFQGALPPGQHAVTVTLIFVGRNPGPITYFDNYRFHAESTAAFTVAQEDRRPAAMDVFAREHKGANVPFEKKPELQIAAAPGSSAATAFRALGTPGH
jgi:hypothetical protein